MRDRDTYWDPPTRGKPDVMEPGRELDLLVAEKMGARWIPEPEYPGGPVHILRFNGTSVYAERRDSDGRVITFKALPRFSTNIADAWHLVDRCGLALIPTDDGWLAFDPGVHGTVIYPEPGVCDGLVDLEIMAGNGWAVADTAPHAICLAALQGNVRY